MPELPEVETTKASLSPLLGKTVSKIDLYQPKLRWAIPNNIHSLEGYQLKDIKRRAKYLILVFKKSVDSHNERIEECLLDNTTYQANQNKQRDIDNSILSQNEKAIIVHLGMSGSLQQFPKNTKKRKHDHLIISYSNPLATEQATSVVQLHYHDPRRFGAIVWFDEYGDKLFGHLGVEPLDDTFSGDYLYNKIHKIVAKKSAKTNTSKPITRPIKAVIMDQAFVVGVGNIYATESLFLSKIHPSTPAHLLSKKQLITLTNHIKAILQKAIEKGGSTLRDFTVADGTTGYFQQTLNVYGKYKQPCPLCATEIDRVTITGRASTFCPKCQPIYKPK